MKFFERVQRRFTRMAPGMRDFSELERLEQLKFLSLDQTGIKIGNGAIQPIESMLALCRSNHCPVLSPYPCRFISLKCPSNFLLETFHHLCFSSPRRKWVPDIYHFLQMQTRLSEHRRRPFHPSCPCWLFEHMCNKVKEAILTSNM